MSFTVPNAGVPIVIEGGKVTTYWYRYLSGIQVVNAENSARNFTLATQALQSAIAAQAVGEHAVTMASRALSRWIPDVRAGSGVTVSLDAQGYVLSASGGGAVESSDNILANQVFGG